MKDLILLLPEIYIFFTALGVLVGEVGYHGERVRLLSLTAWMGIAGALIQSILNYQLGSVTYLDGLLVSDGLSLFVKPCLLIQAAATLFLLRKSFEVSIKHRAENIVLVLIYTLLMMISISSHHLLVTGVLITGVCLLAPLLLAQKKRERRSVRSAFYFTGQSLISMLFIFVGIILLFSASNSFLLPEIHRSVISGDASLPVWTVAVILFSVGVTSLMGIFPGFLWTREGYSGGPMVMTQLLSWSLRFTLGAVLLRALVTAFGRGLENSNGLVVSTLEFSWMKLFAILAGATLFYGSLLAYRQTSFRKLLAALGVVQSGFVAIAIMSADQLGYAALLYLGVVDLFVMLGLYGAFSLFLDRQGSDDIRDLRGMMYRAMPEGILLTFCLFTFVGLPPLAGFISRTNLINITMRHHWDWLTVIAIFAVVLSSIACARFVLAWIHPSGLRLERFSVPMSYRVFLMGLGVPLVLLTFGAEWILRLAGQSVGFIFW